MTVDLKTTYMVLSIFMLLILLIARGQTKH